MFRDFHVSHTVTLRDVDATQEMTQEQELNKPSGLQANSYTYRATRKVLVKSLSWG